MALEDKDIAEFLAMGLRWNQIETSKVVAWADSVIRDRSNPPDWAIELSIPPCDKDEIVNSLLSIGGARRGAWARTCSWRCFVANGTQVRLSGYQIARILYGLLQEGCLPQDVGTVIYTIDDGYDLAAQGICREREANEHLRLFLERFREYDSLLLKAGFISSDYLRRPDAAGYLKVLEVLREWDRIGVISSANQDEYDSYAPAIVRMLDAGVSEALLFEHMAEIVTERMGINVDRHKTKECASQLVQFWKERRRTQ